MFYRLPAAGNGKIMTGTGKNWLPEDSTLGPVSGSRQTYDLLCFTNWTTFSLNVHSSTVFTIYNYNYETFKNNSDKNSNK